MWFVDAPLFILYILSFSRQSYGQPNLLAASGICRLDCSLQKTKFTNLKLNTFKKAMTWILELYRDNPNAIFLQGSIQPEEAQACRKNQEKN